MFRAIDWMFSVSGLCWRKIPERTVVAEPILVAGSPSR